MQELKDRQLVGCRVLVTKLPCDVIRSNSDCNPRTDVNVKFLK